MTITEFLLARIAEDEAVALAASHQKLAGPFHGNWRHDSLHLSGMERDDAKHIARHDPARVLAECTAKRALVGRYEKYYATRRANWMNPNYAGSMEELGWTLQTIAAVYADHPDYQPEWVL